MKSKLKMGIQQIVQLIRNPIFYSRAKIWSEWHGEHIRNGKVIDRWVDHNMCTNEGLTDMLNVHFGGGTQKTTWYIALVESNTAEGLTKTYASPGYTECTAYDEAARVEFDETVASNIASNTLSPATFTFNDSKTIYGGSIVSYATKGDTAQAGAKLFCYSLWGSSKSVVSGDIINLTIVINCADA